MLDGLLLLPLGGEPRLQPVPLILVEPRRLRRTVGQVEDDAEGHEDRGQRFEDEKPLPAVEPPAGDVQQRARDRGADDGGEGDGEHEQRDHPGAVDRWEPQGQVIDDSGEEPRLRDAEEEAERVEHRLVRDAEPRGDRADEGEEGGDDAPAQHDAGDPEPRAEPVQGEVGGHFQQEVGDEEQPRAEAVGRLRQAERRVHLQLGEADVHAVQVGDEIAHHQERHEPPHHLGNCSVLDGLHGAVSLPRTGSTKQSVTRHGGSGAFRPEGALSKHRLLGRSEAGRACVCACARGSRRTERPGRPRCPAVPISEARGVRFAAGASIAALPNAAGRAGAAQTE